MRRWLRYTGDIDLDTYDTLEQALSAQLVNGGEIKELVYEEIERRPVSPEDMERAWDFLKVSPSTTNYVRQFLKPMERP